MGSRTNRNILSPKNLIGNHPHFTLIKGWEKENPESKLTLTSSGKECSFTPQSMKTITKDQKSKESKQINPTLPSLGWEVCSHRQDGGLSPKSLQGLWASFPWGPGPPAPSSSRLSHVEEEGGLDAPQRSSESPLFSKPFPRGANLTPIMPENSAMKPNLWCHRLVRGIHWAPQRDNQDDSPASELWWTVFHKLQIQQQIIYRYYWSSFLWTLCPFTMRQAEAASHLQPSLASPQMKAEWADLGLRIAAAREQA